MPTLFQLAFALATPFWALMIVAPGWSWTQRIVGSPLIVVPIIVLWLVIAIPRMAVLWPLVSSPSLGSLQAAMVDGGIVTLVWAQVIAWDLFIGRWMYLESRKAGIHPLVMAPVLIVTILLSPIGFLVFVVVRRARAVTPVGSRP